MAPDGLLRARLSDWNDDVELFVYASRVPELGARLELELFSNTNDDGHSTLARATIAPSKWFPLLLKSEPCRTAGGELRRPSTITVDLTSAASQGGPPPSLRLTLILATSPRGPQADVIGSYHQICQAQAARATCDPWPIDTTAPSPVRDCVLYVRLMHRVVRKEGALHKMNMPFAKAEADILSFVGKTKRIPVPRLISLSSTSICMEEIQARTLDSCIDRMTCDELGEVSRLLQHYLAELHHLPLPHDTLGQLHGGPYRNQMFGDSAPRAFSNVVEFHALLASYLYESRYRSRDCADLIVSKLPRTDDRVLVHGDLRPQNIMVRKSDGALQVTIVDWGSAAILPSTLWEKAGMRMQGTGVGDKWKYIVDLVWGPSDGAGHTQTLDAIIEAQTAFH
ncbi:hypothetical protein DACRYDRAFT_109018 [Dacryopinax primogenitus]|uniref:Protein kinase domain-containing protein n=1 Tax=Dacryopinax primogenitus (strain DJM 731) TaxID=1858805 RepID=M5FVG2_DACPD|nr:uncharacterized protein DACRYDRAFT_109018 [Dacryopinax primogenitus]EJU00279.1 hypothetical protein DACRYDRAFT_109018 [Dacryopinax primogenitus]